MAFYIKPPEGSVSLASLEKFGRKRLVFLKEVLKCDGSEGFRRLVSETATAIDSECLIEGSKRDRTSHFLLRLVCCEDNEMFDFLLQAETELFGYRFSNMNTRELFGFLKSTHRFVTRCLNFKTCANDDNVCNLHMALDMIYCSTSSWQAIVEKYMNDCNTETFQIPFQLALSLIAGRQVKLKNGLASVPFSKLHVVLSSLFHTVLKEGLRKAAVVLNNLTGDREMKLMQDLKMFCQNLLGSPQSRRSVPGPYLSCYQLDEEISFFPPCMKHLHGVLRQRHRLRHHSRVQYTLYLKEIGLPLDEALVFWRNEYSQPQTDRSGSSVKCYHSWQKDHKRYIYNIRHMYGLEGSRTNYSAHSCKYLQMYTPGPGEEGGCPFSQSDDSHLQTFMDIEEIDKLFQEQILSLSKSKHYTEACRKFFISKMNTNVRKIVSNLRSKEHSYDEVTKKEKYREVGDAESDIEVPQCSKRNLDCGNTITKEPSEQFGQQVEATGRLLKPDIRLGEALPQCSKEIVPRTIENNSGDVDKTIFKCSCYNMKVDMVGLERTPYERKCAVLKQSPDVCKRMKVSHNSNFDELQNLKPKDSCDKSEISSTVSVSKTDSFTVLRSCRIVDGQSVKGNCPFADGRMDWANESHFVENLTRHYDVKENLRDSGSHTCETELLTFTRETRAEVGRQVNEMTGSDSKRKLQKAGMTFQQLITLEGGYSDQNTSSKILNPRDSHTIQGCREFPVSNIRGNFKSTVPINENDPCRKSSSVGINEGAFQQLCQNIREQDIRKPSDFYTSYRKFISELKSLEVEAKLTTN